MKLIRFVSNLTAHKGAGQPVPAKRAMPDWFKHAESFYTTAETGDELRPGLKECKPYMDAMVTGYYLVWPCDVHVKRKEDGSLDITWESDKVGQIINERPKEMGHTMPRPYGFAPNHLVFAGMWGWRTPKGWSTLVTHPLNQVELPFYTVTAFMDSDEFWGAGNIPFFIRDNWEGTIKEGTPFAQIIPIKRESWAMSNNDQSLVGTLEAHARIVRDEKRSYKRTMWHRKEYN